MADDAELEAEEPPKCSFCLRDVSKVTRIVCDECTAVICVKCFQLGPEGGEHKRGHNYSLAQNTSDTLFDHRFTKKDEQELIQIVHRYKLSNWDAITQQLPKLKKGKRNPADVARHFHVYFVISTLGKVCMREREWAERRKFFLHDISKILGDPSGQELYCHAAMEALMACKDLPKVTDDDVIERIHDIVQDHFDGIHRTERKRKAITTDLGMYTGKPGVPKAKEKFPYGESEDEEWWEKMVIGGSIDKKERDRYYEDQFVCGEETCMALTAHDVDPDFAEVETMIKEAGVFDADSTEMMECLQQLKLEADGDIFEKTEEQKAAILASGQKKRSEGDEMMEGGGETAKEEEKKEEEDCGPREIKRAKVDDREEVMEGRIVDGVKAKIFGEVVVTDENLQKELSRREMFKARIGLKDNICDPSFKRSTDSGEDADASDVGDDAPSDVSVDSDVSDPTSDSDSDVSGPAVFDYAAYEAAMLAKGHEVDDLYSDWDDETGDRLKEQLRALVETGKLDCDSSSDQDEDVKDSDGEDQSTETRRKLRRRDSSGINDVAMADIAGTSGMQLLPSGLEEEAVTSEDEDEEEEDKEESEAPDDVSEESDESEESSDSSESEGEDVRAKSADQSGVEYTDSEEELLDRMFGMTMKQREEKKLDASKKVKKTKTPSRRGDDGLVVKFYDLGSDGEYHSVEEDRDLLEHVVYGDSTDDSDASNEDDYVKQEDPDEDDPDWAQQDQTQSDREGSDGSLVSVRNDGEPSEMYDGEDRQDSGAEEHGEEQDDAHIPADHQIQRPEDEEEHHEVVPGPGIDDDETEHLQMMQLRDYADQMEEDEGAEDAPVPRDDQPVDPERLAERLAGLQYEREGDDNVDLDATPEARFGDDYEHHEGDANNQSLAEQLAGSRTPEERGSRSGHHADPNLEEAVQSPVDDSDEGEKEEEQEEQRSACECAKCQGEEGEHSGQESYHKCGDDCSCDEDYPDDEEELRQVLAFFESRRRCRSDCEGDCQCAVTDEDLLVEHYTATELLIPSGEDPVEVKDEPVEEEEILSQAPVDPARDASAPRQDAPSEPAYDQQAMAEDAADKEIKEEPMEEDRQQALQPTEAVPRSQSTPGDEYLEEEGETEDQRMEEEGEKKDGEPEGEDEVMEENRVETSQPPAEDDASIPLNVDTGDDASTERDEVDSAEEKDEDDEGSSPPSESAPASADEDDDNTLYQLAEGVPVEDDERQEDQEDDDEDGEEGQEGHEESNEEGEEGEEEEEAQKESDRESEADAEENEAVVHSDEESACGCADCLLEEKEKLEYARQMRKMIKRYCKCTNECACPDCTAEEADDDVEKGEVEVTFDTSSEGGDSDETESESDATENSEDELLAEVDVRIAEETDTHIRLVPYVYKLHEEVAPAVVHRQTEGDEDNESIYDDAAAPAADDLAAAAAELQLHEAEDDLPFEDALETQDTTMADESALDHSAVEMTPMPDRIEDQPIDDEPCCSKQLSRPTSRAVKRTPLRTRKEEELCGLEEEKEEEEDDRDKTPPMLQGTPPSAVKSEQEQLKTPIMVIKKVHARGRTNLRVETRPRTPINAEEKNEEKDTEEEPAPPPKKVKKISKEFQQLFKDIEMREWEEKTATQMKERAAEKLLASGAKSRFVIAVSDSEPEDDKSKKKKKRRTSVDTSTSSKNFDPVVDVLPRSARRAKSQVPVEKVEKKKKRKSSPEKKKSKKTKKATKKDEKKGKKRPAPVESERESSEEEEEIKTPQKKKARRKSKRIVLSKKERKAKWNKKIENRKAREEAREKERDEQRKKEPKVDISSLIVFEQHEITYFTNVYRRIPFDVEDLGFRNRPHFKSLVNDIWNMGYSRERDDFEVEYYNEAETMISKLNIFNTDPSMPLDMENEIKMAKVERYMRVLQERRAMRNQIAEYETLPEFFQLCKRMNNEKKKLKDIIRNKPRSERFDVQLSTVLPRDELLELKQAKQRMVKMRVRAERLKEIHEDGRTNLDGAEHLTRFYPRTKFGLADSSKKVPQLQRRELLQADEGIVREMERLHLLSDPSDGEEGEERTVVQRLF